MKQGKYRLFYLAGIIAPIWLLIGVIAAGSLYPGYSHLRQALSELGAIGAPTHLISPVINNFPIGILFIIFGIGTFISFRESKLAMLSAAMFVLHGIGSIVAGIYSCDIDCSLIHPSTSQNIHNIAGLLMFTSLLFANALWIFIRKSFLNIQWFPLFSLTCLVLSLITFPLMLYGLEHELFGLFQRMNYGIQVIWVMVLAFLLYKE